ncbi:unnamed protein product [Rodentolepis nana]|uniref:PDZ domain-containing protein n=1 Tax=Rodentolepis nana TaxID=102285 RepID=A0A0R3TKT7_RODNA|nr:unnamed protein product [Rodentolepis nana]
MEDDASQVAVGAVLHRIAKEGLQFTIFNDHKSALSFLSPSAPVMPSYEQMQFYSSQFFPNQQRQQHQRHQKARAVFFQVILFRSSLGFGFFIRGGHEFNQMPLAVLRVAEGGPAYLDGRLKVGDELLQINGFMTAGMSHRRDYSNRWKYDSSWDHHSPRETRHLDFIVQFTSDIRYIYGTSNVVADAMSRTELNPIVVPSLDLQILGSEQKSVPDFMEIHFHVLSHPSIRSTTKSITDRFVWKNIRQDVAKDCIACQASKVYKHTRSPLNSFLLPEFRFRHIHVDIVGPLPPSNSFSYTLTCIDRFTRWPDRCSFN